MQDIKHGDRWHIHTHTHSPPNKQLLLLFCFSLPSNFVRRGSNTGVNYYEGHRWASTAGRASTGGNQEQRTARSCNTKPKKVKPEISSVVTSCSFDWYGLHWLCWHKVQVFHIIQISTLHLPCPHVNSVPQNSRWSCTFFT